MNGPIHGHQATFFVSFLDLRPNQMLLKSEGYYWSFFLVGPKKMNNEVSCSIPKQQVVEGQLANTPFIILG